jgi:hypothetical protein
MSDPGLLQALDYILNHSDEATIEVLAEAVVRRRRNMSVFSALGSIPDPQKMSKELTEKINEGIGSGIEGMRKSIRKMIVRIVKEHAPELTAGQVNELCEAWLPDRENQNKGSLPSDMLLSMIEQFISFSNGTMNKSVDDDLRREMGAWPKRYWETFPPVIRQLITDFLKNKISEKDFRSKIVIALGE